MEEQKDMVLEVENLNVKFVMEEETVEAVNNISCLLYTSFWERHWTVLHETDDLRTYSCNYFCPLLTGICPEFPIYSHIFCTINIKNHHKQAERVVKHSFSVKFM